MNCDEKKRKTFKIKVFGMRVNCWRKEIILYIFQTRYKTQKELLTTETT